MFERLRYSILWYEYLLVSFKVILTCDSKFPGKMSLWYSSTEACFGKMRNTYTEFMLKALSNNMFKNVLSRLLIWVAPTSLNHFKTQPVKSTQRKLWQQELIIQYFLTITYAFYHILLLFVSLYSSASSPVAR